jgi:hypothetical protein
MGLIMMPNGTGGFIPIFTGNSEPATCPHCHKEEDIKRVCRNCNYEYPQGESSAFEFILIILLCIVGTALFAWGVIIFADWIGGNDTLVNVIVEHWNAFIQLMKRIY